MLWHVLFFYYTKKKQRQSFTEVLSQKADDPCTPMPLAHEIPCCHSLHTASNPEHHTHGNTPKYWKNMFTISSILHYGKPN